MEESKISKSAQEKINKVVELEKVKAEVVAAIEAGDVTDVTELSVAVNKSINSLYQANADRKITGFDIAFLIDDIGPWQKAIEDLDFADEIADSEPTQIREIVEAGRVELADVPADQLEDILNIQAGLLSGYRIITRKFFKNDTEV